MTSPERYQSTDARQNGMYPFNLKSIKPRRSKIPANRKNSNKAFFSFVVVVDDVSSFVFA